MAQRSCLSLLSQPRVCRQLACLPDFRVGSGVSVPARRLARQVLSPPSRLPSPRKVLFESRGASTISLPPLWASQRADKDTGLLWMHFPLVRI